MSRIINKSYRACREILEEKKEYIEKLAERLLLNETLNLTDIVEIMGERPFPMKENVAEYLKELHARKVVDEQIDAEEAKLKEALEAKKKADSENIKFDIDAAERDEKAEHKAEEDKNDKNEKK